MAIDTASHHGFSSGQKIAMFDTQTMEKIKDIDVQGRPDGIMLEPFTGKVLIFSHQSPSITMIDPKDGTVTGTIDVGGAMEQAQSDGQGKLYVDVEDEKKIAVVDLKAMKVVTKYDLGDGAGEPGGLGFDVKNHILFAMCARPNVCVVVNADDGKVLATLPIGNGTDGGGFNPATMEAFSSQRDGTLTIIKESSPTSFAVEQTVQTKAGLQNLLARHQEQPHRFDLHRTHAARRPATRLRRRMRLPASGAAAFAAVPATWTCCGSAIDSPARFRWNFSPASAGRAGFFIHAGSAL